jgi:uncharacterized protein YndB with AHSA1/START domain
MIASHSVTHGEFTLERTYPASRERVFAAWSTTADRARWFGAADDFLASVDRYALDFRLGGHERLEGPLPDGRPFVYDAVFQDIVDGERIICSYDVLVGGRRISVSLLTVVLRAAEGGTQLVVTEQGAFLDGLDTNEQRIEGMTDSLDQLGAYLEGRSPA